jgi:hypothetical protein
MKRALATLTILLASCSVDDDGDSTWHPPTTIAGGGDGDGDTTEAGDGEPCEDSGPMEPDLPQPLIACTYIYPWMFITESFECPDETTFYCEEGPVSEFAQWLLCCDEIEAGAECHWEVPESDIYAKCPEGMIGFCEV